MRHWMTFALALLVSFAIANTADAKKPKPTDDTATAGAAAPTSLEMATTGIADVDNVFNAAVEPLKTIRDTRTAIDNLGKNLNTSLGLAEGTPLADGLKSLKEKAAGKLQVAMNEQGMPELKASEALPEDVQKALDGANASLKELGALVPKLASLPQQFTAVAGAAAAINPGSLAKSGVKPLEVPKVLKAVTGNIGVLGKAPGEVTALVKSVDDLKGAFAGLGGGGDAAPPAAPAPAAPAPG